ncbi:MAG: alternative ribosome rescue aminoacyl-tRNA hydrolase ArfB [Anaerolineae bacterium]|jgi:ribosome-associated protein
MIRITRQIAIEKNEIEMRFVRASGPGGQHADRAATAVQLRFDVLHSPSLPEPVRWRLMKLAENRITGDGVLLIEAREHRSQDRNRKEALRRLVRLIRRAARKPRRRRRTKPTRASEERRLREKRHRSKIKRLRQSPTDHDRYS